VPATVPVLVPPLEPVGSDDLVTASALHVVAA
jgi:hypothetical protein